MDSPGSALSPACDSLHNSQNIFHMYVATSSVSCSAHPAGMLIALALPSIGIVLCDQVVYASTVD